MAVGGASAGLLRPNILLPFSYCFSMDWLAGSTGKYKILLNQYGLAGFSDQNKILLFQYGLAGFSDQNKILLFQYGLAGWFNREI